MRLFFLLVLLANAATFAYIRYIEGRPGVDAQISMLQISPDKVKLLKAGAVAPAANRETPPATAVCVEWGVFSADEAPRAAAALTKLEFGERLSRREGGATFWVYIPPFKTRAEADKKANEVRGLGITGFFVVPEPGPVQFAISLGVFKTEEAANIHLAQLRSKGIRSAIIAPYGAAGTTFVIREPGETGAMKLAELKAEFPAAELRAAACVESQSAKN
jgi:hypothetical protein